MTTTENSGSSSARRGLASVPPGDSTGSASRARTERPDADTVIGGLRTTFDSGRTRSLSWRRAQLEGLQRMLAEHESEIAAAIESDLGRSPMSTFMGDIAPVTAEITHTLAGLATWARGRRVAVPAAQKPGRAWVEPQPLGVVLVMGAWNFPVLLTLQPLVSALAAGNTVALKPSELSPATADLLADLTPRYVDPSGVEVVTGGPDVGATLLEKRWDSVFFTGSTRVGRLVATACAEHLTPVTLELGGKSPVIVAADADLDVAARRIAWAKAVNAGQACIAPDYVLVEESARAGLVARLLDELPRAGDADPCAIVNTDHFDRLAGLLDGHEGLVTGGELRPDKLRISPALITDPDPRSALMQEEIFGPLLPLVSVPSVADAIEFVNARPRPLSLYLFTSQQATVDQVVEQTTSGSVVVNHLLYQLLVPELPFGGVGPSGLGSYHGRNGFDTFSHLKSVLQKPTRPDLSIAYPPYGRAGSALMRRLLG